MQRDRSRIPAEPLNPLLLQLARDLSQGRVRVRSGRMEATDLLEHLTVSGATQPEAEAAVRDMLTRMIERRARRTEPAYPTCPRCGGGVIPEKVYDEEDPELMVRWRCLRCGQEGGAGS